MPWRLLLKGIQAADKTLVQHTCTTPIICTTLFKWTPPVTSIQSPQTSVTITAAPVVEAVSLLKGKSYLNHTKRICPLPKIKMRQSIISWCWETRVTHLTSAQRPWIRPPLQHSTLQICLHYQSREIPKKIASPHYFKLRIERGRQRQRRSSIYQTTHWTGTKPRRTGRGRQRV